ncbi:MAG: hypothetical protein AAFO07_24175, partial [Bacteroidota bacterium]
DHFITYTTDTKKGSSGSMVTNDFWEVIALHSQSIPQTNNYGQIMLINGQIWKSKEEDDKISYIANGGILINSILKDIYQKTIAKGKYERQMKQCLKGYINYINEIN